MAILTLGTEAIWGMSAQIGRTAPLQRSHASFGDFVALMKPRVMSLVVFTALVGLLVAPGHLDPLIGFVALLCIAAGSLAAGALNLWCVAPTPPQIPPTPPPPPPPRTYYPPPHPPVL